MFSNIHETQPRNEETTQANDAWKDSFYEALLKAFPNPLFSRFKKEGLKDIVSWTSHGTRFFFSWHALEPDEIQFEADQHDLEKPSH